MDKFLNHVVVAAAAVPTFGLTTAATAEQVQDALNNNPRSVLVSGKASRDKLVLETELPNLPGIDDRKPVLVNQLPDGSFQLASVKIEGEGDGEKGSDGSISRSDKQILTDGLLQLASVSRGDNEEGGEKIDGDSTVLDSDGNDVELAQVSFFDSNNNEIFGTDFGLTPEQLNIVLGDIRSQGLGDSLSDFTRQDLRIIFSHFATTIPINPGYSDEMRGFIVTMREFYNPEKLETAPLRLEYAKSTLGIDYTKFPEPLGRMLSIGEAEFIETATKEFGDETADIWREMSLEISTGNVSDYTINDMREFTPQMLRLLGNLNANHNPIFKRIGAEGRKFLFESLKFSSL